jgi:hypothetical protein
VSLVRDRPDRLFVSGAMVARLRTVGVVALVALLLPLILLYVACYLLGRFLWGAILRAWFWRAHASKGRPILFVYSESPNWQTYIEENILPRIRERAVVLDWSQRRLWSSTSPWEARFFRHFSGDREFNPLALVSGPHGRVRRIRFRRAFLDLKHGDDAALRDAEAELLELMEAAS